MSGGLFLDSVPNRAICDETRLSSKSLADVRCRFTKYSALPSFDIKLIILLNIVNWQAHHVLCVLHVCTHTHTMSQIVTDLAATFYSKWICVGSLCSFPSPSPSGLHCVLLFWSKPANYNCMNSAVRVQNTSLLWRGDDQEEEMVDQEGGWEITFVLFH